MSGPPIIYVDADACPVKDEAVKVAQRYRLMVRFVSNGGIRPSRDPMIETIVVPAGLDVADDWIVEHAQEGDVVVTSDIPLASRSLAKGAHVLSHAGRVFTPESIGLTLGLRNLSQHLRETGAVQTFNPGFTAKDRSAFLSALDTLAQKAMRARKEKQQ